jgi:3-isopropylmalate/(R)-2-methylmalate dehydratase small subunit
MEAIRIVESNVVSMPQSNIDTDQIIPARFLQKPRSDGGCGSWLFYDLRFLADGRENPNFILNQPEGRGASILAAGENFGCGSSRENAVWALYDYGFRAVIAPSFGDIFFNNCLKNGLLPVRLPNSAVEKLLTATREQRALVDLSTQKVTFQNVEFEFSIDRFARHCLLNGVDELGYTLSRLSEIERFEEQYEDTL